VLVEVVAPDEPILYAEARPWHDPSAGIVYAILPPILSRASEVLGAIVAAAGGVPLRRSPANEEQAIENAVVRLRAHRIHTVVAMHSQWLPDRARAPLAGAAAMAGIWLVLVNHEFHPARRRDSLVSGAGVAGHDDHFESAELLSGPGYEPDALDPWRDAQWGWVQLREVVRARAKLGGVDADALDAAIPLVGLAGPRPVRGNAAASAHAAAAYDDVVARCRHGEHAASALRHVLRDLPKTQLEAALVGAAAGLGEAGYAILRAGVEESIRRWRDLWRIPDPAAAAALVLRACRISDADGARLRVADIAEDGTLIATRRGTTSVPAGAAPFLRAQRLLAGPDGRAFLLEAGQAVGSNTVDRLVREGLLALGLEAPGDGHRPVSVPSAAWLLDRGIVIRRDRLRPSLSDRDAISPRRCRHALPDWIEVAGVPVSHSQRLCRTRDMEELAPAGSPYSLMDRRFENGVAICLVDSPSGPTTYWQIPTPLGPAWLQSRAAVLPVASAVADGVAIVQRRDTQGVNRAVDPSTRWRTTRSG
jgi:hypothetical protein